MTPQHGRVRPEPGTGTARSRTTCAPDAREPGARMPVELYSPHSDVSLHSKELTGEESTKTPGTPHFPRPSVARPFRVSKKAGRGGVSTLRSLSDQIARARSLTVGQTRPQAWTSHVLGRAPGATRAAPSLYSRPVPAEPQVVWMPGGVRTEIHLTGDDTGGAFCLLVDHPHAGWSLPPHIHEDAAETIHVIEGEFEMTIDGVTERLGPGQTVHIPAGVVHSGRQRRDRRRGVGSSPSPRRDGGVLPRGGRRRAGRGARSGRGARCRDPAWLAVFNFLT